MKFGRKSRIDEPIEADDAGALVDVEPTPASTAGPYDATEVEDLDERDCIDLGSLLVTPAGPLEMRLQVDEQSGEVIAAVLVDQQATQITRISGHEGPNWLLRATLMGQPAAEPATAELWEQTIRSVVVRRGREAMAPGAPLRLTLPPDARQVEAPGEAPGQAPV